MQKTKTELCELLARYSDLVLVVPDIHANDLALESALEIISEVARGRKVVFLGDYLDRGRSSVNTIQLLIEAKARFEIPVTVGAVIRPTIEAIFLLGNHEKMLLDCYETGEINQHWPEEGNLAFREYEALGGISPAHLNFLKSLKPYHQAEHLIFVHGGIDDDGRRPIENVPVDELVWTYHISKTYRGLKIVHGHQMVDEPTEYANHICLDAGVARGEALCIGLVRDADVERKLVGWLRVEEG